MIHKAVLTKEFLEYLNPKPNENFIDCTVGEGGHSIEILKKNGPNGKVLGIDLDPSQVESARLNLADFKERIILINDSYSNLEEIVKEENFRPINGVLLDLGMSSRQLEKSGRGFSFQKDEVLDMRYDLQNPLTAEKVINEYSKDEIEKILINYGEEKFAGKIAEKITERRKIKRIKSTFELRDILEWTIPTKFRNRRIHCATKTFQALRIAVNNELDNLIKVLPKALNVLSYGGRLAIISFHSLEDRIVKNFLKEKEKEKTVKILTKKPIIADRFEILKNPRARSAKLRALIKK